MNLPNLFRPLCTIELNGRWNRVKLVVALGLRSPSLESYHCLNHLVSGVISLCPMPNGCSIKYRRLLCKNCELFQNQHQIDFQIISPFPRLVYFYRMYDGLVLQCTSHVSCNLVIVISFNRTRSNLFDHCPIVRLAKWLHNGSISNMQSQGITLLLRTLATHGASLVIGRIIVITDIDRKIDYMSLTHILHI